MTPEEIAREIVIDIIKDMLGTPGTFHDVKWVERIAAALAASEQRVRELEALVEQSRPRQGVLPPLEWDL